MNNDIEGVTAMETRVLIYDMGAAALYDEDEPSDAKVDALHAAALRALSDPERSSLWRMIEADVYRMAARRVARLALQTIDGQTVEEV